MNKILILVLSLLAVVVLSATVSAATLTVVSGTVTDKSNTAVDAATVTVVCTHNSVPTTKIVSSGVDGKYYAFFPAMNCAASDSATVTAEKDGSTGSNTGAISYLESCRINVGLINVQIPEFGVIAGGLALLGAVGVVIYRRKN